VDINTNEIAHNHNAIDRQPYQSEWRIKWPSLEAVAQKCVNLFLQQLRDDDSAWKQGIC